MSLNEAQLASVIPRDALQRFDFKGTNILHIDPRYASTRWGLHLIDRAKALDECRINAGGALDELLDEMILDKQVRCFFLLNPWSITDEFLKFSRQRNLRLLDSQLLGPIGSRDEKGSIEYLHVGCVPEDALTFSPYEHPLTQRQAENTFRAMSILTLVLMKELSYLSGTSGIDEYKMLNDDILIDISKDDPRRALTRTDEKYRLEELRKTLRKLKSRGVLERLPGSDDLYELNPHILNIWTRGLILELFVHRILLKKVSSGDMFLCPVVLSYPRLSRDHDEPPYDRLTGFHEVDLLFRFRDNLYFTECKNFACSLVKLLPQYDEQMKFLGKISDIERYYGISSKKILVQTSHLHTGLTQNPRDDLLICDCESAVSNLKDALEWLGP